MQDASSALLRNAPQQNADGDKPDCLSDLRSALARAGKWHEVREMGELHFARAIEERLAQLPGAHGMPEVRRSAIANAMAGALFALLFWWIRGGMPMSSTEADELFHSLLWHGAFREG